MPVFLQKILFVTAFLLFNGLCTKAQEPLTSADSFFLGKKKGILSKMGKSISRRGDYVAPVKTVNDFKQYHLKIIRKIIVAPVGFNHDFNDTSPIRTTKSVEFANKFHKNTYNSVIRKNLFFKEGQPLYALVVADNERYLREQLFLKDAMIVVMNSVYSNDSVDVIVLTRDVFSIGGSFSNRNIERFKTQVKDENLGGSGNRISFFGLYDQKRYPATGYGVELEARNILGSFINWTNGFKTFATAFNSGRLEEINAYSVINKPMASRYTAVTGAAKFSYHSTTNGYLTDSLYNTDFTYRYITADIWAGYNIGHNSGKRKDAENRLRHFVALRGLYTDFMKVPGKYLYDYNYRYVDINGGLMSYSLYRQNFYRTNFIYGFGVNEDVAQGINATLIGGYINMQGINRSYYGAEFEASRYNKKGSLINYTFKTGGFINKKDFQDVNVLMGINGFTKLRPVNKFWYNRNFMGISYTRQINPYLNEPLVLQSEFGLPYYRKSLLEGKMRTTFKFETVFYNIKKIAGFRIAPLLFTDLSIFQSLKEPVTKNNGFPAFGAGVRTRNENLVFGTIELKGYYFPRIIDGMQHFRVQLKTNLKFKYNTSFIHTPDFARPN